MKKKAYIILIFFALFISANAQVTIGRGTAAHAGSILEIESNSSKGLLLPRVSLARYDYWQPLEGTPDDGMLVFNTNTSTLNNLKGKGTYVWYNNRWNILQRASSPCTSAPGTPVSISFNTRTIDKGSNNLFIVASVPEVKGASSYSWVLPVGLTGTSNENYITITASASGSYDASQIKVSVSNDCGSGSQVSGTGTIEVN
ncbi:hypothetical protein M2132_000398 [Dysgonomonas sp. PH5-45]|uniref:hypothetical protein n=1 Tax=unclassified Dysgonomonas TaxID=2630389 RepID=UPI0024737C01|nr:MULTISPECIES: hypothetical protein [unclassified Dysgonomonas]MDH6354076.1 hypothetical protein [Dysgonomonas sp. PH5-45]MDH6387073.1 hypothetical protein [Dysgonomonas sp. PH5-37]